MALRYWFLCKFGLIAAFTVLALAFFIGGRSVGERVVGAHATGQHIAAVDLIPHDWGLIVSLILPVLIFNWVSFELQNGTGEEMVNPQRDVPRSLIRAGNIAMIAYTIPITVILFTLTKSQHSPD
jgi:glutamate:GABA antiporter